MDIMREFGLKAVRQLTKVFHQRFQT